MKNMKFSVIIAVFAILLFTALGSTPVYADKKPEASTTAASGEIYLYGESHGVEAIMDKEFELWYNYYHEENMRHLFVEYPYYTAEYLNMWMDSDNDEILDEIYHDWKGTQAYVPETKEFYQKIKKQCPETVFHGTDVGHQYNTIGERYIRLLQKNGLEDSQQFESAQRAIEQGKNYYGKNGKKAHVYRENKMAENFIREFDKLNGERVMGIYGAAHIGLDSMNHTNQVESMANQLHQIYNDAIYSEDISNIKSDLDPIRIDRITINGKTYDASYFGKQDLSTLSDLYISREFWRLEEAYDDFADKHKTGQVLPYSNYPTLVKERQVFVIDYTAKDGSFSRKYFRSDEGFLWNGLKSTVEFVME